MLSSRKYFLNNRTCVCSIHGPNLFETRDLEIFREVDQFPRCQFLIPEGISFILWNIFSFFIFVSNDNFPWQMSFLCDHLTTPMPFFENLSSIHFSLVMGRQNWKALIWTAWQLPTALVLQVCHACFCDIYYQLKGCSVAISGWHDIGRLNFHMPKAISVLISRQQSC